MLIRFSFKNFKSFKNENCLDMEATSIKEHDYNLIEVDDKKYLKVAAIYGANASGKTNILQAFNYMKNKLLITDDYNTNNINDGENLYSFMHNSDPIGFEVEILARNNNIYKYGFEILKNNVESEWLFIKKSNKFVPIFERDKSEIELYKYENTYAIDNKTLFLNVYTKLNAKNEDFSNVYNWFMDANYLDLGNPVIENAISTRLSINIISNEVYKKELIKFIQTFDTSIEGIKITPETLDEIKNNNNGIKIDFIHKTENDELKKIPIELESNGTKKMFFLFDFIIDTLKNGRILFIDELDAKLHPLLTRYIINLFHNKETNIGNGQLIYSTHDTVNLNKDTFRRDEIWFVEKDCGGNSSFYSLSDYKIGNTKVRNDATYNKDYLSGRYGAIPILKNFEVSI